MRQGRTAAERWRNEVEHGRPRQRIEAGRGRLEEEECQDTEVLHTCLEARRRLEEERRIRTQEWVEEWRRTNLLEHQEHFKNDVPAWIRQLDRTEREMMDAFLIFNS